MKASTAINSVTLTLPDKILTILRRPPDEIVQILRVAAAVHWYGHGVLPQEKALELAGLDRSEFFRALGQPGEEEAV